MPCSDETTPSVNFTHTFRNTHGSTKVHVVKTLAAGNLKNTEPCESLQAAIHNHCVCVSRELSGIHALPSRLRSLQFSSTAIVAMFLLHYGTVMPLMEAGARSWLGLRKAVHRAHPARQTQEARVALFPFQQTSIDDFVSLSFSYSLYMMFFSTSYSISRTVCCGLCFSSNV